ncbi:L,D-transpeptidase [Pseudonocardia sp. H11422]|uniref:L,D-transpeptidase n=1 Tax=Pseudonocardia sp. H11422 TaxID=2835866 RepID=UPI001BDBE18D|nr:L,D-transpeptidase [Pseudonocardia sp. H11422]
MRALRVLGLAVLAAVTGLLSGGAAGAVPTTAAIVGVVTEALPFGPLAARSDLVGPAVPVAQPAPPAQPAAPVPAAPAAAPVPVTVRAPAPVTPAAAAQAPVVVSRVAGTPCRSTARACVDLSSNRAWLISEGVVQYGPVPITHGRRGWRTPPGTFTVTFKNRHHRSSLFNDAPMPYSVFFNGGIAFHQGSLTQKSHGCVHLSQTAARTFFGSLSRGDVVQVVT